MIAKVSSNPIEYLIEPDLINLIGTAEVRGVKYCANLLTCNDDDTSLLSIIEEDIVSGESKSILLDQSIIVSNVTDLEKMSPYIEFSTNEDVPWYLVKMVKNDALDVKLSNGHLIHACIVNEKCAEYSMRICLNKAGLELFEKVDYKRHV